MGPGGGRASAHRLAAIAELVRHRSVGPVDYAHWSCDNWDSMAAEVAAAQGIRHGIASGQMYLAVAKRDRLPRVAALFANGTISARLAATIAGWRTGCYTARLNECVASLVVEFRNRAPTKPSKA